MTYSISVQILCMTTSVLLLEKWTCLEVLNDFHSYFSTYQIWFYTWISCTTVFYLPLLADSC